MVVIDSVAALTPRAEIEGEMGDLQVGAMARMMSAGLPQASFKRWALELNGDFHQPDPREDRRDVRLARDRHREAAPLKFFASVRMRVSRGEQIKDGTVILGNRTKVRIDKNKIAPPFREAEFDLIYGKGIAKYGDLIDLAVTKGLIQKGGAWFTVGEERFQGRDNVRAYLEENTDFADNLETQIREAFGLVGKGAKVEVSPEADVDEGEFNEDEDAA
jgi:recombination protein RecA